jgi:hypothetical protein
MYLLYLVREPKYPFDERIWNMDMKFKLLCLGIKLFLPLAQDLLKDNPSSVFTFLVWSSVFIGSLIRKLLLNFYPTNVENWANY